MAGEYINDFMGRQQSNLWNPNTSNIQGWPSNESGNVTDQRFVDAEQPIRKEATQLEKSAFDPRQQVGHDGKTSNGMTREQYRDAWMGSGVTNVQGAKDWLGQHGGEWLSDNGTVRTPFGETMDMLIGARGSAAGTGTARAGWGGGGAPAPSAGPSAALQAAKRLNASAGGGGAPAVGSEMSNTPVAKAGGVTVVKPGAGEVDPFAAMGGGVKLSNGAWVPSNHPLAQQAAAAAPAAPTGVTTTAATNADPMTDPKGTLMRQLMDRMRQDLSINKDDPIIKGQVDSYNARAERARKNYLADTAEASSPYATGAMRGEARMTAEKLGQNTAQFEAELRGRELTTRRQEIQHALDSMGSLLTEQERQTLQRELARADNDLRRYGIDTQNSQYFAGLGQQDRHFYDQLSQADRLAMLDDSFRNAQLGQNQNQFLDNMGFQTADRQRYWDAIDRGVL